jgi:sugar lactone lactonase YvrE
MKKLIATTLSLLVLNSVPATADMVETSNCVRLSTLRYAEDFAIAGQTGLLFAVESDTGARGIKAFRVEKGQVKEAPVEVTGFKRKLNANGIDFFATADGLGRLYIVNRAKGRLGVEVFQLESTSPARLRWVKSIRSKKIKSPNDVRAMGSGLVFISNDWVDGLLSQYGNIVACQGNSCRVVADDKIGFANGLASRTQNGETLLFNAETLESADSANGAISVYSVGKNGALTRQQRLPLKYGPDNIQFDAEGRLWAAALPSARVKTFLRKLLDNQVFDSPSAVFQLSEVAPKHWQSRMVFKDSDTLKIGDTMLNSSTGAVRFHNWLFMTSVTDSRSYACRLN